MKRQHDDITQGVSVLGCIGSGTYGSVYVVDGPEGRHAVKLLNSPKPSSNTLAYQDIVREFMGLSEANLLRGTYVHKNRVGLVMDVGGSSLGETFVQQRTLPEALGILRPIAEALARMPGMHRDVKPANILLPRGSGSATLVDFSLATNQTSSTDECVVTLWYRAPEVIIRERYTNAVDVWALGVVLLTLLVGSPFLRARDEDEDIFLLDLLAHFGFPDEWPALYEHLRSRHGKSFSRGSRDGLVNFDIAGPAAPLLRSMLRVVPGERPSWATILADPVWALASRAEPSLTRMKTTTNRHVKDFFAEAVLFTSCVKAPLLSLSRRLIEMDHMLYYAKKFKFTIKTAVYAYKIYKASGLVGSPSMAASMFVAASYNEDIRTMDNKDCESWAQWAHMWDEPEDFTDSVVPVLMMCRAWPQVGPVNTVDEAFQCVRVGVEEASQVTNELAEMIRYAPRSIMSAVVAPTEALGLAFADLKTVEACSSK